MYALAGPETYGLLLGYPVGISFGAYGPWMIWFLVTGVYLVRGGRTKVVAM